MGAKTKDKIKVEKAVRKATSQVAFGNEDMPVEKPLSNKDVERSARVRKKEAKQSRRFK